MRLMDGLEDLKANSSFGCHRSVEKVSQDREIVGSLEVMLLVLTTQCLHTVGFGSHVKLDG